MAQRMVLASASKLSTVHGLYGSKVKLNVFIQGKVLSLKMFTKIHYCCIISNGFGVNL